MEVMQRHGVVEQSGVAGAGDGAGRGGARGLPWSWFEFGERACDVGTGIELSVGEGGGERAWKVDMGGGEVLFKVLRGGRGGGGAGGGKRPWLMLMHGMGLGIGTFRGVAPYLMETHDLILPDYGGFFSRGGLGEVSFKWFVESMWRIADAVGVERMSVGGNSLGGGLSLMAGTGRGRGRIERMVLSNPACYPQELPGTYRMARVPLVGEVMMSITAAEKFIEGVEYIGFVDKSKFDPELRGRYVAALRVWRNKMRLMEMMRQLPAGVRDTTAAVHVERLRELEMPVMLTWGAQDPLLAEGSGERLAGDLRKVVVDWQADLAHMPHEEAPERVGKRWAGFLNSR